MLGHDSSGHSSAHAADHHDWQPLGDGKLTTQDADHGLGHIVSFSTYTYVFFALLILTGITVWAAFQDFGVFNLPLALGIATAKAGVVTLIFMHLNFESKIIWGIVIYPLFIFLLIIAGTLGDASVKERTKPMHSKPPASAPATIQSSTVGH